MKYLELKIPPPVVAILLGAFMWGISMSTPAYSIPIATRGAIAAALALIGVVFDVAGLMAFRRARTTVNPMKPELASLVVSSGIYRITRNPMYVGLVFILLGWNVYLASPWALLGVVAFVLYIGRFQIQPEEQTLEVHFGADYAAYKARVRRWL